MAVLLGVATGVRVWFMVGYPTAFVGFPDASQYVVAATSNIFRDAQRPAGYPFFLRLVHHLSDNLTLTIAVQHAIGMATGLLLYKAVRRTGAPPWLGLLPAAVVFFGGAGVFLEQSLLSDSLFAFLQAVVVYMAIRALYDPAWRWPLLAGLAIGLAFWVRTAAVTSAILVPLILGFAARDTVRRRLGRALVVAIVAVGMIFTYVGTQYYFTGYLGYERESAWNLYGRVATFADCSKFTPPRGTAFLCLSEPPGRRHPPAYYQYSPKEPPTKYFGPLYLAPASVNTVIQKFALAAIVHEPVKYLGVIAGALGSYVFPRSGEGYTPQTLVESLIFPGQSQLGRAQAIQAELDTFYPHSRSYLVNSDINSLSSYERHTRIEGALLAVLLACAIAGLLFVPAGMRWAAVTFLLIALSSITFAVGTVGYDARYAYPTFGPLAAAAALGAWGIGSALTRTIRRRRSAGDHIRRTRGS